MTEPEHPDLQAAVAALSKRQPAPPPIPQPAEWDVEDDVSDMRRVGTWHSTIPSRFINAELAHADPLLPRLTEWAANPRGRNLLLWGGVGAGKTHLGVAAARVAHFERHQDVLFWPVVELLDQLRDQSDNACRTRAMREAMDVDVLVLDDLGGEKPTDWTAERLYAIVNRRWLDERPTIGTTNLPLTNKVATEDYSGLTLDEALGGRTFSRLVGSGAVVLRLAGPDRRR